MYIILFSQFSRQINELKTAMFFCIESEQLGMPDDFYFCLCVLCVIMTMSYSHDNNDDLFL